MQEETAAMPGVLLFRQWCMRHNAHLTSKKTLVRLMKGKYWNELAKIINSWRGHGNAAKTCRAYAARFGMERANAVAATPPLAPSEAGGGLPMPLRSASFAALVPNCPSSSMMPWGSKGKPH